MWEKFRAYAAFPKAPDDEHDLQWQNTGNIIKPLPEKDYYAPGQKTLNISAKTIRKELLRGTFEARTQRELTEKPGRSRSPFSSDEKICSHLFTIKMSRKKRVPPSRHKSPTYVEAQQCGNYRREEQCWIGYSC